MESESESAEAGDRLLVLVAGGGVAGLEAALALKASNEGRMAVELLAPEDNFIYRPLAVAEPFRVDEVRRFPLQALAEASGAFFRQGAVASVDPEARIVRTSEGEEVPFDVLLLACGARPVEAVPGALTFRGPDDDAALAKVLASAREGTGARIAFVLPVGATWPLPLYELALLMNWQLSDSYVRGFTVTVVTPEESPLRIFGDQASQALAELLEIRGISVRTGAHALAFEAGRLRLFSGDDLEFDDVIALPRLEGVPLPGIPQNADGFVDTDEFGQVRGLETVYAAGDITSFPLKQGGIAAQQADTAAGGIAARAGASARPRPFRPILRGLLLTGGFDRYLRAEASGRGSTIDAVPLWWPPTKIVGRYLSPFLAMHAGIGEEPPRELGHVPVEVELELVGGSLRPLE